MAHPELEAKLRDNPDDHEAYIVYADHLQSIGDPRGELIALQAAGKPIDAFIASHADALLGPLAPFAKTRDGRDEAAFEWHLGFIRAARLSFDSNASEHNAELEAVLEMLLTHPSGKLLQELVVPMNMLDDGMYFGPIIAKLAALGAPMLHTLRIGEFQHAGPGGIETDYDYEISWTSLGDATGLWQALPKLRRMRLQTGLGGSSASGSPEVIGDFDVPKLEHMEVITGGMSQACLQAFAGGHAPELVHMDLWLGSDNYGATGTAADLAPIFDGANVPKLTHLGIMNSEIADSFIDELVGSKLLRRLRELDLSYGTLSDEGAARLHANARSLGHLERLVLSANCLTEEGIAQVRGLCANVVIDDQKGEDEHYASLSE